MSAKNFATMQAYQELVKHGANVASAASLKPMQAKVGTKPMKNQMGKKKAAKKSAGKHVPVGSSQA